MKKQGPVYHKKPDSKVLIQTSDWFDKLKSGTLTKDEEIRFYDWLAQDPAHQAEFEFMSTLWDCTDILADEPLPSVEAPGKKSRNYLSRLWRRFGALNARIPMFRPMAGVAAALLVAAFFVLGQTDKSATQAFETFTGEQKTVYLKDGSSVCLDAETKVSTEYTLNARKIGLVAGRASFSVVHDPKRPFVVSAGDVFVRAVGTKFSVFKREEGMVSVAVTEGKVNVSRKDPLPPAQEPETTAKTQPIEEQSGKMQKPDTALAGLVKSPSQQLLGPGQEVVVDKGEKVFEVRKVETAHIDGWQNGRLFFQKTPLGDVIEEINRYLDQKIVIGDARLKNHRISIIFKVRDRKYFLKTLERSIPIVSEVTDSGKIVIKQREETVFYDVVKEQSL